MSQTRKIEIGWNEFVEEVLLGDFDEEYAKQFVKPSGRPAEWDWEPGQSVLDDALIMNTTNPTRRKDR